MTDPRRSLPSVAQLARELVANCAAPESLCIMVARAVLANARRQLAAGDAPVGHAALSAAAQQALAALLRPGLRPVINASGVIIQTNLGRAPLSAAALQAMADVGGGYSNLEYDLEAGVRGTRGGRVRELFQQLTGAEDALVVNNNAAAIYLTLGALASGRAVIVSRGQAVEIGGGFRIPDVLRQSGARLVEVGTTNRTYARDYAEAIDAQTALIMRVHASNFRLVGFVHEATLAELVAVARAHRVLLLDDLGSGTLLPTAPYGLPAEPTVGACVAAGADLVAFSGDKLLGGPQAGVIVGSAASVGILRRHPLMRALRVDKTTLAALEATLLAYVRGRAIEELPVWRMIAAPAALLQQRAAAIAAAIGPPACVVPSEGAVGGGALPGATLPGYAVALPGGSARAARLRRSTPPVVARIVDGRLLLDLRSVLPEHDAALIDVLRADA
jgi:L-seryl-tRNA(Ser) seleniumtransferase